MEITQLEFFIKVVEEGGFSKAASRVYRTQPAVSIAVKRLEEEVGAPLLDRSQKTPTRDMHLRNCGFACEAPRFALPFLRV